MKKLIFFTLALVTSLPLTVHTQNTFNTGLRIPYDPCTGCSDNNPVNPIYQAMQYFNTVPTVKSDFGPRYVLRSLGPQPYDWHGGIDYSAAAGNGDRGYHLRSIVDGVVHQIGAGGVKYIVINGPDHDFGYLHIFSPGSVPRHNGDCHMVELTTSTPQNPRYGIIVPNGQGGLMLLSDCTNCTGHYYIHNGVTLNATNQVAAGSIIAALGDSGANGNAHLHLNRYESLAAGMDFVNGDANMLDPLQFVEHFQPNYQLTFHNNSQIVNNPANVPQGIVMKYPGTAPTKIMIRPFMQNEGNGNSYTHGTLNIAEAEVLIKKQYLSDYELIKGATYESRVSLGAITTDNGTYPGYVGTTGVANKGGWNRQGVFHFAYRDGTDPHGTPYTTSGGRPYDDFYFTDFISRIRNNDALGDPVLVAYCPMSSRYNDGLYHLKARVTDVRGGQINSPVQNLTIDNYKPFIRSVKVGVNITIGAQTTPKIFYQRRWDCDDVGCQGMKLSPLPVVPNILKSEVLGGLYVTIEASEPLQSCALQVNNLGNITQTWQQEDGRIRQFHITPSQVNSLLSASSIALKFTGTDWSNNALIALDASDVGSSCVAIPKRTGTNSWEDDMTSGTDVVHFFNPGCGAPRDGEPTLTIIPDESCFNYGTGITWEVTQPSNHSATNGAIVLNVTGGVEPYRYNWSNGGTTDKAEGLAPGEYCVTVYDALCCEQKVCIELCPNIEMPPVVVGGPSTCNGSNGQIYFLTGFPAQGYPYTYLWNTGATTLSLFYIPSGTYSLTVTDANGCTAEASYTLLAAGEPMANLESAPPCPGLNNGLLIASATPPGETGGPYNFVWSSGLIEFNNYLSEVNNVGPGNYCVTITDATNGAACPVVRCVQLDALVPDGPLTLKKEDVVNSCAESASGSITLDISGGIPPQPGGVYAYTIQWANGLGSSSTLNNLAPGTYCYTVTDYCGATASNCVEVQEQENTAFDLELLAIQHVSLPSLNDGLISVATTVAGEYSFQWSNGVTGPVINSLATGTHQVTVTNLTTGCSIIRSFVIEDCFEVPTFDARLIGDLVGAAPATFYVQIAEAGGGFSGNIPPGFSILWETVDGAIGHGATVTLPANFSGNWVQATVSNGCTEKVLTKQILRCPAEEFQNPSSFFIASRIDPCHGFSDGRITLAIPKPENSSAVTVVMDEAFEIPVSGEDDDFYYIEIGNLAGNIDFKLKITVGDCDYEFTFRLGERSFEQQFDRIEGDICFYDQACDGHTFSGDEQFQEPIQFDWPNTTGSLFSGTCKTPLLCGSNHTGQTRNFGQATTSAVGYLNTLNQALLSDVYPPGYIDHLLASAETMGECRLVRYCSGSLKFLGHSPMNPLVSSEGTVSFDPNTGCQFVDCAWPTPSYLVCPDDADVFGGVSPETSNCFPRRMSMFDLIQNRSFFAAEFPLEFPGSTLDNFLLNNLNDERAACAYVVFCQTNFSFLTSNLNEITCGIPLYSCGTYAGHSCDPDIVLDELGNVVGWRIFCESGELGDCPNGTIGEPLVIIFVIKRRPVALMPTENLTELPTPKVILDAFDQEQLHDFGIAQLGDIANPKVLINTAQGFVMEDFDPVANQVLKHKSDTVVTHYVSDWEKQITVYIEALQPDTAYQLIYEDTSDFWIMPISASTSLNDLVQIRHMSISPGQSEVISVGGMFQGDLIYNNQVIATATELSSFLMRVRMEDGGIADLHTFKGLFEVRFSENRKGAVVLAGKRAGDILVNNQTWIVPSASGITVILVDEQNQTKLVDHIELPINDFKLKDVATTENGFEPERPVSIALWGTGEVVAGGQTQTYNDESLIIVTVTRPGGAAVFAATPATNLNENHFDMAYDQSGESLMAGFTIQNTVNVFGETFQSAGGQDILLTLFRIDGQLSNTEQFGGVENENVSKVLQNHNVLYFGGEFDGSIGDKTIGQYVFSNLVAATTRAYISFLTFEEPGGVVALTDGEEGAIPAAQVTAQNTLNDHKETAIAVFPNPFNNKVRIQAVGENIAAIQVVNALGQLVYDFRDQAFSDFEIDFGEKANGIYFLKFYDHSGALVASKSVVKMN